MSAQAKKKNETKTNLQLKITIKHRHEMCDAMRSDAMWCDVIREEECDGENERVTNV